MYLEKALAGPTTGQMLHVKARDIPMPSHLSAAARIQLAQNTLSLPKWPPLEDIAAWRELTAKMDAECVAFLNMKAQQIDARATFALVQLERIELVLQFPPMTKRRGDCFA